MKFMIIATKVDLSKNNRILNMTHLYGVYQF